MLQKLIYFKPTMRFMIDFDMTSLSKSYLDSTASLDNDNLYIRDYKLVRADHPGNIKRGSVSVYFKDPCL